MRVERSLSQPSLSSLCGQSVIIEWILFASVRTASDLRRLRPDSLSAEHVESAFAFARGSEYGLLDLPKDTVPGTDIRKVVGLDDYIFDISVTANRPDCQSVLGIAREVAAALGKELKMPATDYTASDYVFPGLDITVEAPDLCPRDLGHGVRNITVGESPRWM